MPPYDDPDARPAMGYDSLRDMLSDCPEIESPALIHGWAAGTLATGLRPEPEAWVEQLYEYTKAEPLPYWQVESLLELFESTLLTLQSSEFTFQLFLPNEEECSFEDCLQAFSQWCQGFLHGFATVQESLTEEAKETLKDFTEISQIDCDSMESDENEGYFIELEEFARMAVMSLFMEYAPESSDKGSRNKESGNKTEEESDKFLDKGDDCVH